MRILFVGDVVGRPGRQALKALLPGLRRDYGADVVVVNGENSAGGLGITADTGGEILAAGADLITLGNHVWDRREALRYLEEEPAVIRPANYPPGTPGSGSGIVQSPAGRLGVINVAGRVFSDVSYDCPFRSVENELESLRARGAGPVLVDIHAEATSEKMALAYYLDGKVSAVLGTHTHVQTADARILPHKTAYLTDVGMTGPRDSIIGVRSDVVLRRFLTQMPVSYEVARHPSVLCLAFLEVDPDGRALAISAHQHSYGENGDS